MNNLQGPSRSMPYEGSHRHSQRKANDRVNYRPKGLRGLLRWATRQWELESPARIHAALRLLADEEREREDVDEESRR